MSVNLDDVAKYVGVSRSTVSLVVNGSNRVKEETRIKVLEAINKLGYVPNLNARNLIKKQTNILGVIIIKEDQPCISYEFDYETGLFSYYITNGIPAGLLGTDYGILTEHFCTSTTKDDLPHLIKYNRVDGVIIVGGLFEDVFAEKLLERGIPAVVVGRYCNMLDSISANVTLGCYMAVKHLIDTGHKRICYINCPLKYLSSFERLRGFEQAIRSYHACLEKKWIINSQYNTGKGGYDAFKSLWESGVRPDGIAAANEPIAMGIIRYLYEQKIRIPDDISIIGYEDSVLGGYSTPALTTINISKEYMGEKSTELLLRRIKKPDIPIEHLTIVPHLVIRDSVKQR